MKIVRSGLLLSLTRETIVCLSRFITNDIITIIKLHIRMNRSRDIQNPNCDSFAYMWRRNLIWFVTCEKDNRLWHYLMPHLMKRVRIYSLENDSIFCLIVSISMKSTRDEHYRENYLMHGYARSVKYEVWLDATSENLQKFFLK